VATTVARLEAILGADTRGFDRGMDRSESRMKSVGKAAALGGLAIAAGIGVGLKKSADAAMEAEKAQARLNQALAGAGISQDKYGASIQANIEKTSKLAALDDEDLSDSFAKLVRATGDVTKATEGMNLAADIARSRNISLEAATKMVERASIGNAAAFSRVGIAIAKSSDNLEAAKSTIDSWRDSSGKLTEAEDQKAKKLLDSAKALDKQATAAAAFDEAQRRFADGAKKYGETAAGAQERFGVAVENLQEKIGAKLLPVLAKLMEVALKVIESIERNWPKIMAVIGPVMEDVREIIQKVTADIQAIWEKHGETIMRVVTFAFNTIRSAIQNAMTIIQGVVNVFMGLLTGDWERAWDGIKGIVQGVFNAIKLLLTTAITVWGELGGRIGSALKNAVIDGVTGTATAVWNLITNIGDLIAAGRGTIIGWGASVGNWIKQAVVDALVGIGTAAWGVIDNIGSVLNDVVNTIKGWGRGIANAIKNGIADGLDGIGNWLWDQIKGGLENLKNRVTGFLGKLNPFGDAADPNFNPFSGPNVPAGPYQGINLMGARPEMMPFAIAAQGMGLRVTSGLRPGAITANGTPSDHGIGKALDLSNGYNTPQMAAFFKSLIGNPSVKQAFYDPLGSIFGGKWSSYKEGGHTDHVHVATYDKGGWLMPGLTLAHNGTGRPERVGGSAMVVNVTVHGWVGNERSLARQIRDALNELDRANTGGRVLRSTPTLT
jgi:hypothetical protein